MKIFEKFKVEFLKRSSPRESSRRPKTLRSLSPECLERRTMLAADLFSSTFDVPELTQGDSFTATYRVRNTGSDPAGQFQLAFFLSTDGTIDPGNDFFLREVTIQGIGSNSGTPLMTVELTLPPPTDSFWDDGIQPNRFF